MSQSYRTKHYDIHANPLKTWVRLAVVMVLGSFNFFSDSVTFAATLPDDGVIMPPDSINVGPQMPPDAAVVVEPFDIRSDRMTFELPDTIPVVTPEAKEDRFAEEWVPREVEFSPDPTKAVWMSALFPGLGQVYNRRYWKLPIIVGGYLGLAYATSWNTGMLNDYTQAYADIMDSDPSTKSYMDFFPSTVNESDLDKTWLTNILRSRKNYFRRNRDLCIISMVGVYLLAMVDAYVDASLSHFDISPDLSIDLYPTMIQDARDPYPSVGLQWALNF